MADIRKLGICKQGRRAVLAFALASCFLSVVAAFAHPGSAIFVDRAGVIYFVDTGSGVYKVDARGTLTRLPGPAFHWMVVDEANRFRNTRMPSGPGWEIDRAGADPTLLLSSDYPVALGADGSLYYPLPAPGGGGVQLERLAPSGESSVFARLPAQASGQPLRWLNGLATGPDGSLYYTEDRAVHRVSREGRVSTVVANVAPPNCARIPMEEGERPQLRGLAVDAGGTVYVAASGCGSLLKVAPDGKVSAVLQLEAPWSPTAVAVSGGNLYVLEYLHTPGDNRREWVPRVRKITADGKSAVVASVRR